MAIRPYRHHIFVCLGKRCSSRGSEELLDGIKGRIKSGELAGVRVSRTGCQKLCRETDTLGEHCPALVVYPEGVWYKNVAPADLDEIITEHIEGGRVVERLLFFRMSG